MCPQLLPLLAKQKEVPIEAPSGNEGGGEGGGGEGGVEGDSPSLFESVPPTSKCIIGSHEITCKALG